MKMKEWIDRQVHESFLQLKVRWAEWLLTIFGLYLLLGGLAQPFITVVPHGTPEGMRREMFIATLGFSGVGLALLAMGRWLTRGRKNRTTNQQIHPIAGKPGSG